MNILSPKKSKSFDFNPTKLNKAPLFALATINTPTKVIGQKRKVDMVTPESTDASTKRRFEPSSAPAPAGRSPRKKHVGILSRRRMTSSPFTRINPPSSLAADNKNGLPFSIDAALAGTVPSIKSKSKSYSKTWNFEIHEDSPDVEMGNLMEHSVCTLDISDDESGTCKGDRDNKENIPPVNYNVATQPPVTRRDMMTDEVRSPLGDLNAKEFYAEGCDASSFIIIPTEDVDDIDDNATVALDTKDSCPSRPHANAVTQVQQRWEDVLARVAATSSATATDADFGLKAATPKDDSAEIQIWESETAKGHDDTAAQDHPPVDVYQQAVSA